MRIPIALTNPYQNDALLVRGFCTTSEARALLESHSVEPIFCGGVEDAEWAVMSFRKRPGVLAIAQDLRIFGETQEEFFGAAAFLSRRDIELHDVRYPDAVSEDLLKKTVSAINATSGMKDKRTAKKRGRLGGLAKKLAAQQKREALDRDGVLTRLFNHKDIPWRVRMEIAGPTVKASSARRHFCNAR